MTRALQNFGRPGCCLMLAVMLALLAMGAAVAFCSVPHETILRERFDELEIHQFHNEEDGKHVFSQYIFRAFHWDGSLDIHAWRMAKGDGGDRETICLPSGEVITVWHGLPRSNSTPRFNHNRGVWELYLSEDGVTRCIEARTLNETGRWYDPEVEDRELRGKEHRRELRQALQKGQ